MAMIHCECGRLFASTHAHEQQKTSRMRNRQTFPNRPFTCPIECCRRACRPFSMHYSLTSHQISRNHWSSQQEKNCALEDKVCQCGAMFHTAASLEQHVSDGHCEEAKSLREQTPIHPICQSFSNKLTLTSGPKVEIQGSGQKKKTISSKDVPCQCGKVCNSAKALEQHMSSRKHRSRMEKLEKQWPTTVTYQLFPNQFEIVTSQPKVKSHERSQTKKAKARVESVCYCGKVCKSKKGLEQHKSVKHAEEREMRTGLKRSSKLQYMEEFYDNNVKVNKDDRTESVAIVRETLSTMMAYVRSQPGGEFYHPGLTKAGSHAVHTKIGKADEFDWGVPLNVAPQDMMIRTTGSVPYTIFAQHNNLNIDLPVENRTSAIPVGYAAVSLRPEANVPRLSHLLHGNYLVPRFIKQDLYNKIKTALEDSGLAREGVHINRESHGPALTLTIMPPKARFHHISLDIVPSLPCDIPLTSSGWPRPLTTRAFRAENIQAAKDAGTHLVPKKDTVFDISYSKAEKALLEKIDSGNGCRKKCHKVIKKYVQTFSSRNSASGISSHIFKQQLLNMVEAHPDPAYWNKENFGERAVDMLRDCEYKLRVGMLQNHFVPTQNVLAGKDRSMLNRLADFFEETRTRLQRL